MGIINGTTNYILTKMAEEDLSFETALQQAQDLGYAEPTRRRTWRAMMLCINCPSCLPWLFRPKYESKIFIGRITKISKEDINTPKS